MATYNVQGTFQIRTGTPEEWADISQNNKYGNLVLKKGEMGWEEGTSNFKIGDGSTPYRLLPYIQPIPPSSPYALRLGTEGASYSYQELQEILSSISSGDFSKLSQDVEILKGQVSQLQVEMENSQQLYFPDRSSFPAIGKQGPLYVDKETGNLYFFNIDEIEGEQIGYVKLTNSFDIIQCELD